MIREIPPKEQVETNLAMLRIAEQATDRIIKRHGASCWNLREIVLAEVSVAVALAKDYRPIHTDKAA